MAEGSSDLEGEGAPCRVFSVGHHGDVAPLHRQPLGQRQHGDRGVVGATRVKLQYYHVVIYLSHSTDENIQMLSQCVVCCVVGRVTELTPKTSLCE